MPKLRAFRAFMPSRKMVKNFSSLPYDVMNRKEAKEMVGENPYSMLRITRSEIELPDEISAYDEAVYLRARQNLDKFIADGILKQDDKPMLYIYKLIMGKRTQSGIVGIVNVDDYKENRIKKHELTRKDKEVDRNNHFYHCNACTEPVFLAHHYNKSIADIKVEWMENHHPEYDFVSDDGIGHMLWKIDDDGLIARLSAEFESMDSLYIADGHHRSASAANLCEKKREEAQNYNGEESFNYFLAVAFDESELEIMDYNRLISDLNSHTEAEFLSLVGKKFNIVECLKAYHPDKKAHFGMYLSGKWYELVARDEIYNAEDVLDSLDVSILQNNLIAPILGIEDVTKDSRIDFSGGIRGLSELERRVDLNEMRVAFSMHPTSIAEVLKIADLNLIMPPKSTWFEPKLRSGLFIYQL